MRSRWSVSRREFLGATASTMGALAFSMAARTVAAPPSPQAARKAKSVVHKVYLAKPVPTWPCPDIDLAAEVRKLDAILEDLRAQCGRPVELVGGELLRTTEDLPAFQAKLGEVDGLLVFNLTSGVGRLLEAILGMGYPTVLFSQPYSGHDWSWIGQRTARGDRVDVVSSSDFEDLLPYLRIFDAIRRVRQTTILCIRQNREKDDFSRQLEQHYGVKVIFPGYHELKKAFERADTRRAAELADPFIARAIRMVEPSRTDVVNSMRLYLAVCELLREYDAEVITIDCLGGFQRGDLPAYPCVAWTLLNNAGQIGVCEADLASTMTQILGQYLTGKPGFVSDPVIDTKTNTVIHAHCVAATRMDGPDGPEAPYLIRTHMEDNKGVSLQVKMRIGQAITLAKLADVNTMILSTGEIIDNPDGPRGCRTKVATKVADADRMLHNYRGGLHRLLFYGDHVGDFVKLGRLIGYRTEMEM
ncbi:MAG: hypothetical protein ONB23_07135 [candidate division KSB1 bacterium]|nr:hypothetical protein [candidate division KSB1 bacterium]